MPCVFCNGCATTPQTTGRIKRIRARGEQYARECPLVAGSVEKRAGADYLQAASISASELGTGEVNRRLRKKTYNAASAETHDPASSSADGGRLWNHPLTLTNGSQAYHFRLEPASYRISSLNLTSFELAGSIKQKKGKHIKTPVEVGGVGGALVGVHLVPGREFASRRGISAPVTATSISPGRDEDLALRRPAKQPTARVEGAVRPLAADYSAPLLYYKHINEMLTG